MGGSRNRQAGHGLELECMHSMRAVGYPKCVTSRSESRNMDNCGVDLCETHPFYIQVKNKKDRVEYDQLLPDILKALDMENAGTLECVPVILHKKTKKSKKNFIEQGKYAIMRMEDWFNMVKLLRENNLI